MTEATDKEIFQLKKYIEILEEDNKWCHSMINKQQRNHMNFSDLPNNSWEKVMVHLVEHIGGDGGSLVKWSGEIPDPVETATAILGMVQYYDPDYRDLPEGALARGFRAFYKLGEYEK
jgi:hypothetical protein